MTVDTTQIGYNPHEIVYKQWTAFPTSFEQENPFIFPVNYRAPGKIRSKE